VYVRRLKTVKWGFFTPFAHYSWEPELAAMVIFQTVSLGTPSLGTPVNKVASKLGTAS
jgi:hypothetical protein